MGPIGGQRGRSTACDLILHQWESETWSTPTQHPPPWDGMVMLSPPFDSEVDPKAAHESEIWSGGLYRGPGYVHW